MDLSKFKDLYISEAEDHLQKLNDNLLKLEKKPNDQKLLDELMRSAHSLKGSSATMGFTKVAYLTHVLEDVFDYARNGQLEITSKIANELFKTFDSLEKAIKAIKKTNKELSVTAFANKIKKITGVETEGVGKSKRSISGQPIAKKAKKIEGIKKEKLPSQTKSIEDEAMADAVSVAEISHIKVPVERLDKLMSLMEELLIDKMKLQMLQETYPEIKDTVEHLSRLVTDIQYQVMQVRLVPVDQIFARFPRMIRDLSQKEKKEVEFDITGGDLELDRTIIDGLAQPLVHLLRNAVDHGIGKSGHIKLSAERERDYALITVENDSQSMDWKKVVSVAVKRGLITRTIGESMQAKLDKGSYPIDREIGNLLFNSRLSTKDKVTETSGRGVGLSVVKQFVSSLGGRVIVESPLMSQIGDKVSVSEGTKFVLELPLSLAIIKVLLVKADDSVFALPFSNIERTVQVPRDDIKSLGDQDVAVVDKKDVPLARLEKIFGLVKAHQAKANGEIRLVTSEKDPTKDVNEELPKEKIKSNELAVLVKRGRDIAGVVVDELIGEEEITVKPLPSVLKGVKGFSGSTILGDGQTILILDVVGLLEDTRKLLRI